MIIALLIAASPIATACTESDRDAVRTCIANYHNSIAACPRGHILIDGGGNRFRCTGHNLRKLAWRKCGPDGTTDWDENIAFPPPHCNHDGWNGHRYIEPRQ